MKVFPFKYIAGARKVLHLPALHDLAVIGSIAALYVLLFNGPALYLGYQNGLPPISVTARLIFYICASGALFLILSLGRRLFLFSVPLLFAVSSVASYFTVVYGIMINQNTIALLLGSSLEEISGLVAIDLAAWVLVHSCVGILLAYIYGRRGGTVPLASRTVPVLACLLLGFGSCRGEGISILSSEAMPFSICIEAVKTRSVFANLRHIAAHRRDFPAGSFSSGPGDMTIVIIIGESSRPDHYHINGYPRKTSPELERHGAISFPNVRSLYNETARSVPVIFSRTDPLGGQQMECSLVEAFNRAGFMTSWLSAQAYSYTRGKLVTPIVDEAGTRRFINPGGDADFTVCHDGQLLGLLDDELRRGERKKLIVLHTVGSHWRYDIHYPDSFRVFRPTAPRVFNPSLVPRAALVNSYDNSILYTDHVIGEVIDRVKDGVSLVVFVSDHGESLGEGGVYLHASPEQHAEQYLIAMFVWASERYIVGHPGLYRAMKANRGRRFTHRAIFHSALDGAGVSSGLIDPARSLFRTGFRDEIAAGKNACH